MISRKAIAYQTPFLRDVLRLRSPGCGASARVSRRTRLISDGETDSIPLPPVYRFCERIERETQKSAGCATAGAEGKKGK